MFEIDIDLASAMRGIRAMRKRKQSMRLSPPAKWDIRWIRLGDRGFWCHLWTPVWHGGRGPYLTVGIGQRLHPVVVVVGVGGRAAVRVHHRGPIPGIVVSISNHLAVGEGHGERDVRI